MTEPALYMFDDDIARGWQPFTLTRPAGELLLGAYTFRARAEHVFAARCAGHITADHLLGFDEHDAAPAVDPVSISIDRPRIFVSSRTLPAWTGQPVLPQKTTLLVVGDDVIGMAVPAGSPNPDPTWFVRPDAQGAAGRVNVPGTVVRNVWDLVALNAVQTDRDFRYAAEADTTGSAELPPGVQTIGLRTGALRLGTNVTIEPNVVLDFSDGPVWLSDDVTVRAFTRLSGPSFIGTGTTVLGGVCTAVSIGPHCKVRGELEESLVLGYSNKAHDGFLGHAYLGRWVNLGALTTNSDLKNNYGNIRIWTPDGDVDTGLMKLGCLIGDHAKTGIGALINTGSVIGAGANLYGSDMPPKRVPPFSWGSGSELTSYDLERFMGVAEKVMSRRDVALSAGMRRVLENAWHQGRSSQ